MPEKLNELFSLLKQNLAYSIYSLGILEKYNANHFKLNYVIDDYPNFGIIISEFTDKNFTNANRASESKQDSASPIIHICKILFVFFLIGYWKQE